MHRRAAELAASMPASALGGPARRLAGPGTVPIVCRRHLESATGERCAMQARRRHRGFAPCRVGQLALFPTSPRGVLLELDELDTHHRCCATDARELGFLFPLTPGRDRCSMTQTGATHTVIL
jgi:hypothetical protein